LNSDDVTEQLFLVAQFFKSKLGDSLNEVYKVGSLAHEGFSRKYSDIDVALTLGCPSPPRNMDALLVEASKLNPIRPDKKRRT
jgi:hypothetical protein